MDENDCKTSVLNQLVDKKDSIGYDLRVSLFLSALNSYRCDSILKPFPNQYFSDDNEKQFDFVKRDMNLIPALHELSDNYQMSDNCWRLLSWIMTSGSLKLNVRSIDSKEIKDIMSCNPFPLKNFKPIIIFEVKSQPKNAFNSAKSRFGTFWAFHGSNVENFHSILHNGLVNCLNKRSLYGSGTYLSSQLSVAIEFSPFGFGWNNSLLGKDLSCVAVCEVVKHPDIIAKNTNSVPNAYYVVRNDDMIQVSYLFVYCKKRTQNSLQKKPFKFTSSLVFISLLLILFAIGFKFFKNSL